MKKRSGTRVYNQTAVNTVILVVIIALFLYLGVQLSSGFSLQVSTQRTQKITDASYARLKGYIFRDDSVLESNADVVYYTALDGERIGVGQVYAETFASTGLSIKDASQVQSAISEITQRISRLESGLDKGHTVSDLGYIKDSLQKSYYSYVNSILGGNIAYADKVGDELLSYLADYSAITGGEAAKSNLSALINERNELIASIGGIRNTLVSNKSFCFFHSADGYEEIFHTSQLDGLTREGLDALISASPENIDSTIGKMTFSSKWHLAVPIDEANLEIFKDQVGNMLSVSFSDTDSLRLDMLLERVYSDENDPSSAYMLLSSHDLSSISSLDREQNVRILLDESTGYRIPSQALYRVNDQDGVYILVGNTIEFRRVTVIGRGEDYYLVNTNEADRLEDPSSEVPYLNINDMIVTSGNDLYDGKQLD